MQAALTLMGPFMVLYFGMGLVTIPEAARLWRQSARKMVTFCVLYSTGLAAGALIWGVALLIVQPHGVGAWLLKGVYHPTYPLILPFTLSIMGGCIGGGAGTGLHALGAAKRSLRAMLISSALSVVGALVGAALYGPIGTVTGLAISTWLGSAVFWWQLREALREETAQQDPPLAGKHRRATAEKA